MYMYVTCFLAHIHDCTRIVLFTPVCLFVCLCVG